jgi:hypothetical protein
MDVTEMDCKDKSWMELDKDGVQCQVSVLVVLNLRLLQLKNLVTLLFHNLLFALHRTA